MFKQTIQFLRQNWLIVLIVILATWMRTTELSTQAIFFGDAGRDLLAAATAVEERQLPLLGIPSSVPRFHQGPVTVWVEMGVFLVAGYNLFPFSLVFALISIAAVIGIYELTTVYSDRFHGQISALILAVSPLAVAHGRMVYHITPIPLAMILFLWSLVRLSEGRQRAVFWSILAWCFLFQFELAVVPLSLLIPYLVWRQEQKFDRPMLIEVIAAFLIGLAPQIIYDLSHSFAQLGGFGLWVGYRIVSAFSLVGEHAVGPGSIGQTLTQFKLYGLRIVSVDQPVVGILFGILLSWSVGLSWSNWKQQTLRPLMEISWVATLLLILGFAVHSSPSEAYFPVFCVLVPILVGYPLTTIGRRYRSVVWLGLAMWTTAMIITISRTGWFVGQTTGFAYGPSVAEQREIVTTVRLVSEDSFYFATTQPGGQFASYFDNLRWFSREMGVRETPEGLPVFIEPKNSELSTYPTATKVESDTVDIYTYE